MLHCPDNAGGQHNAAGAGQDKVKGIEIRETLKQEDQQVVDDNEYDEKAGIVAVSHCLEIGHHVLGAVFRCHGTQQYGLKHGGQCGGCRPNAGRVGENVCQESYDESPEKNAAARIVEREIQQEADVHHWGGIAEQVHVVEHQNL